MNRNIPLKSALTHNDFSKTSFHTLNIIKNDFNQDKEDANCKANEY